MKTYLIQRNLPGAGKLTTNEQIEIAKTSCNVIDELGGQETLIWQHSYIIDDGIWCVYKANNEEILREHARRGQFPCDNIFEVKGVLSPSTALMTA
jgi:hypothetical protein